MHEIIEHSFEQAVYHPLNSAALDILNKKNEL